MSLLTVGDPPVELLQLSPMNIIIPALFLSLFWSLGSAGDSRLFTFRFTCVAIIVKWRKLLIAIFAGT